MGYIIPVDTFQYQQYHQRITQSKHDPMPIEKVYPSQFDIQYQRVLAGEQAVRNPNPPPKQYVPPDNKQPTTKHRKLYAAITGKGSRFEAEA